MHAARIHALNRAILCIILSLDDEQKSLPCLVNPYQYLLNVCCSSGRCLLPLISLPTSNAALPMQHAMCNSVGSVVKLAERKVRACCLEVLKQPISDHQFIVKNSSSQIYKVNLIFLPTPLDFVLSPHNTHTLRR